MKRSSFFDHVALSRGRVLNHPGHADQKSHGRKDVRDSLAGAASIDQISAVVASEASALTGHPVSPVRADGGVRWESLDGADFPEFAMVRDE